MRTALLGAVLSAATLFASAAAADTKLDVPNQKITLDNGMVVILAEDHALPMVVTNIMVKVGSRFEENKRTGFAHLFEHLMFMGTARAPTKMFDAWMETEGGWNNADTSEDRTDYYDCRSGPHAAAPLLARGGSLLRARQGDDAREAQRPARGRAERAAPDQREHAVRQGRAPPARAPLSGGPSVPPPGHRLARGPPGGVGRRREVLLRALVRAEQRAAGRRRRLRAGPTKERIQSLFGGLRAGRAAARRRPRPRRSSPASSARPSPTTCSSRR